VGAITRVRVEVAGSVVPAWQARCIETLRALAGVEVAVVAGDAPYEGPRGLARSLAGPALVPTPLVVSGDAGGDPDLVVDLAGSANAGDAETLRFRLGEDDEPDLPFAREIIAGGWVAEVSLVCRIGGCEKVLRRGRFRVTRWYGSTLRWALFVAATWPALVVDARRRGARFDEREARPAAARRRLSAVDFVRFAGALAVRLTGYLVPRFFERAQWNVGFADIEPRALIAGEALTVRWLPNPPKRTFIADPFVVERDGRRVVFVEQYDDVRGRGVIEAIDVGRDGAIVERRVVIDLPTHLSYPHALEIDGGLHLLPENAAGGDVAPYLCVAFPWSWQREAAIFAGFDGLDTTLFRHDGRWWAFCTRASRGSDFALYAYYAENPRGPWLSHPLNPIVEDITCARPGGGVFEVDGALYRPGQDCSTSYGAGLVITRIDELCPEAYRETVVRRIDTRHFGRFGDGVHTIGTTSTGFVVDGKRVSFDLLKPLDALRTPWKRALAQRGALRRLFPAR
jgi:hypothetical protein